MVNKKPNRTKGNVQPSSSSRAAQLLSNKDHSGGGGLIGFTNNANTAQDLTTLDPRISAALKKLNKKEAVTKQKALTDILDALTESDIKSCLQFWCRCYPKISIENDRKTRELSQQLHSKIVEYAGRNLAPQLGLLMGPWLEGTCDYHIPASKVAATALTQCFSELKLREAVKFCEKGIIKHIRERLSSSPSTLSDMKISDPFHAEEKHVRVIGSTLRSFVYVLSILQDERSDNTNLLLHDTTLWKLGRSKNRHIRAHVLDFISELCELKLKHLRSEVSTENPSDTVQDAHVTSQDTHVTSQDVQNTTQEMPVAVCKIVTYQLNQCHRDVSLSQWRAIQCVVINIPELFWSEISEPDLKGQIIDSVKSKALLGGVLECVYNVVPVLVIAVYNRIRTTNLEHSSVWLENVFSATLKCLNQCKLTQDKCHVIRVMCYLATKLWSEDTSALVVSNLVCLINGLSSDVLPNNFTEHFFAFLSTSHSNTSHLIEFTLAIKRNNNQIQNTLVLLRVILSVMTEDLSEEFLKTFGEVLARRFERCVEEAAIDEQNVAYVSVVIQNYPQLEPYFCNELTQSTTKSDQLETQSTEETPQLAAKSTDPIRCIINTLFLPLFHHISEEHINSLCAIIIPFLRYSSSDSNLTRGHIRELILSSSQPTLALYSMLLQSRRLQTTYMIPTSHIIEKFPELSSSTSEISKSVINFLCTNINLLPQLQKIIEEYILTLFNPDITDRSSFSRTNWAHLLQTSEEKTRQIILQNLMDLSLISFDDSSIAKSLHKAFSTVGDTAFEAKLEFLKRVMGSLSGENVSYYGDLVLEVFRDDECDVVLYLIESGILSECHQNELCSNSVIIDMYERYGIISTNGNNKNVTSSGPSLLNIFLFCYQFITKSNLFLTDSMSPIVHFLLSSEYILRITSPSFLKHAGFFQTFIDHEWEDYTSIISEFLISNDLTLIYFLKDLEVLKISIKWDGVDLESTSTMFILNLAINFNNETFCQLLNSRVTQPDIKLWESSYGNQVMGIKLWESILSKTQLVGSNFQKTSHLISYITDECLDGQITDLVTLGCVFKSFYSLFKSPDLTEEENDFLACSTATLLHYSVDLITAEKWNNHFELLLFVKELRNLYFLFHDTTATAIEFLEKNPDQIGSYKWEKLSEEWVEFFEPGIQDLILVMLDNMIQILHGDPLCEEIVGEVAAISLLTPASSVQTYIKYVTKSLVTEEISFDICFDYLMKLHQLSGSYVIQRAVFNLMLHCQIIFKKAKEKEKIVEAEEDREFESPPNLYLASILGTDLNNVDSVDFEPLLVQQIHVWCLLLNHEAKIDPYTLREHVSYLKSKQIVFNFLKHLSHFLPLHCKKCKIERLENIKEVAKLEQHQIAATCFMKIATIFPALLRDWWKKQDKELSMNVEKFISVFISPVLIRLETTINVQESDTLKVKSRPVVREVVATYTMDDISAELIINLAANHPLVPPSVSCERQVGVPVSTWRSWMLQITNMFSHQNCSIVEGLQHWKKNMDKQFEGVESCLICFSVVQGPNKALPKLRCKTCKKKFHSACLYKWFSTSGKSTCPMCRSSFQHTTGLRRRLQAQDDPQ